jgi:hypothetical protein
MDKFKDQIDTRYRLAELFLNLFSLKRRRWAKHDFKEVLQLLSNFFLMKKNIEKST